MPLQLINTLVTKKFNQLIEELTRRGMLKGIGAALAGSASRASGQDTVATQRRPNVPDFMKRVEVLVSYLESGIKPDPNVAVNRATAKPDGQARIKRMGPSYQIAYGGVDMGNDINNYPYHTLNTKYKGAKGKYQIILTTYNDLVRMGLYKSVPTAAKDFSPKTQDAIFAFMAKMKVNVRSAIDEYSKGNMDKAIWYLSREWASIPKDKSNLSYYDGDGRNHALMDWDDVQDFLRGRVEIQDINKH